MTHSIILRMLRKNKKEQIAANDNAKHRRLSETDGDTVFNLLQSFWDHLSTTASNPPCKAQFSSGDTLSLNIILLSASLRIHVLHAWEWPLRVHNAIVDLQPAGLLRGCAVKKVCFEKVDHAGKRCVTHNWMNPQCKFQPHQKLSSTNCFVRHYILK